MNQEKKEILFIRIALVSSIALFFSFGFYHINKFITADEHYWIYERVPQYWKALNERKVKDTLINDKPGVSLALTSGLGLLFDKDPQTAITKVDETLSEYDTERIKKQLLIFRLPILFLNTALLFLFFWLVKKITSSEWIALWVSMFISLSPILLGISQIINPDSLLWSFFFGAILSYFALLKFNEKKYLALAILFTSLSLATKYVANILFPFYLLLFIFSLLFDFKGDPKNLKSKTIKQVINYYLIIAGSVFLLIIFIPAILIKPVYLYRLTVGFSEMKKISWLIYGFSAILLTDALFLKSKVLLFFRKIDFRIRIILKSIPFFLLLIFSILIIGRNAFPDWTLFEKVAFDIKDLSNMKYAGYSANYFEKILLEFNPLVFSISPIILILLFVLWLKWIRVGIKECFLHIASLSAFAIIFLIASIESNTLSTVRYSIVLYPIIFLLSAFGLNSLLKTNIQRVAVTSGLIILLSGNLWIIKPFYFNYTNILLSKDKIISDAWGYGGYEAAQFLNAQKDAEKKIIWSDYYGVCEFFKGKCVTDYMFDENKYPIDYYVLTRRGKIRYNPTDPKWQNPGFVDAYKYYSRKDPNWQLFIHERENNYTKIYKADEN